MILAALYEAANQREKTYRILSKSTGLDIAMSTTACSASDCYASTRAESIDGPDPLIGDRVDCLLA